jgi:outer membrane protein assembly factor BamD
MFSRSIRVLVVTGLLLLAFPRLAPAPLIYTPGEGWTYQPVGGEAKWQRSRAKDQLEVAQEAFDKKDYSLAIRAAHRTVRMWPTADYAPQAQYLLGRCYEAKGQDERAFKAYQELLDKHPKASNYEEILDRQVQICDRFLAGQWFKLWNHIPFFPNMERTAEMYQTVVKNGPYSHVAPRAQLKIGAAREKRSDFLLAAKAYELAADRYNDRQEIAAEATYRQGMAYKKQAQTAEYDQSTAGQAIATFTDFMALYPDEPRVPEAQKIISGLKTEQAHGHFQTAKFYERYQKWDGALVYYNEVLLLDPSSPYANEARLRIDALKKRNREGRM